MTKTLRAIDWNAWREQYDSLSFSDQRIFYDIVYDEFPEQARFSVQALCGFLDYIDEPVTVVELGGWDGEFASEMLRGERIERWTNYEISGKAVAASVCQDPRFYAVALEDWFWAFNHEADLLVASHVIEHLPLKHLVRTVLAVDCRFVYFQAPLAEEAVSWHNYRGSHILEVGWGGVCDAMKDLGFSEIDLLAEAHVRCFEK